MMITKWALKNNRVTIVALILVILGGILVFKSIPQAEDPGFTIRTAMVMTFFPGASPERVEKLVTDKLEKVIQEIPELDYVKSETKTGVSTIYVNIKESYKNLRPIWDKLRRKIDQAKQELPSNIYGPFVNDEFGDVYGTLISITGDDYSFYEMKKTADDIRDKLLRIPEVAKVEIVGNQKERIFIEFKNAKLAELGVPPLYIKQLLDTQNVIIPGGSIIVDGKERLILEPTGNLESLDELENMIIRLPNRGSVYYLKDLVSVKRGYVDPPSSKTFVSREKAIILAISMRDNGNIISLGDKVKKITAELQQEQPYGLDIDFLYLQSDVVSKSVNDFMVNLIQSVVIVILVMLIALGLKTGIMVASMIPIVIVMAFLLMHFLGIGIDRVSLGALLIALGMLVDNSIVVSESIMMGVQSGKTPYESALLSSNELAKPLLISSLITSSAFLPIFLAESSVGEYTAPLFKVVAITLLSSWLLSLTIIPLLSVKFLKVKGAISTEDSYNGIIYRVYKKILITILKTKILSVIVIIVLFSGAIYASRWVPKAFFPPSDREILTIDFTMPPSTPIERTEEIVRNIETFIDKELKVNKTRTKGIVKWASFIGESAPRYVITHLPKPPSEDIALMLIEATSVNELPMLKEKIEQYCDKEFPEIIANIKPIPNGMPLDYPIEIRVSGTDMKKIYDMVNSLKNRLEEEKGILFVTDDWGAQSKKLKIKIDQERAYRAGVTSQDVSISLLTALTGFEVGQYRENENVIPITLRLENEDRDNIEYLENIEIHSITSRDSILLKQIASIEPQFQPSKIVRRDRYRTITVQAGLFPGVRADSINQIIKPWLDKNEKAICGRGCKTQLGGEAYESEKSNKSIGDKMPITGLIIILLLVIQFNSIKKPIILLLTVPLGFIGVVIGLLAANSYFGFMTLLAVVSLSGIVINNANVLMDRIRIEIEDYGLTPSQAVIEASQKRLRPIMLTTLTTVGGLIPLWVGGGPLWETMAIALIFGLMFATLLTTLVIPLLYSIFHKISFRVKSENQ
ncbi:efflux RND transporter permease subunit [bacterium]|nr:efflux RND transporter permease subunit [bacterium]